jgi:hypothetical protein
MKGTTNPEQRDKQVWVPVFLISKEFIIGRKIKQGIFTKQGIRHINMQNNNNI